MNISKASKIVAIFSLTVGVNAVMGADKIKFETDPPQRLDVRYRLFKTENIWSFIELDTQTGRAWQLQFTINKDSSRGKNSINDKALAVEGKNGRFTLYPTTNMWNFILLDQDTGRTWQMQFSMDEENRALMPIFGPDDFTPSPEKPAVKSK